MKANAYAGFVLRDRFATNVSDVGWITELDRERGWAVLTRDLRVMKRPHERQVLDRSRSSISSSSGVS